jgi:hypothetical protein
VNMTPPNISFMHYIRDRIWQHHWNLYEMKPKIQANNEIDMIINEQF